MDAADRVALVALLVNEYRVPIQTAGLSLDDTAAGIGPALDATSAIVDASAVPLTGITVENVARYMTLRRAWQYVSDSFSVSDSGANVALRDLFDNIGKMMVEARKPIAWVLDGTAAPGSSGGGDGSTIGRVVTVDLNYLGDPWGGDW